MVNLDELVNEPKPEFDNILKVELRGYELARLVVIKGEERWEQVRAFRPNQYGYNNALQEAAWLCGRQPHNTYRVRVILSLEPTAAAPKPADTAGNVPAPTAESTEVVSG